MTHIYVIRRLKVKNDWSCTSTPPYRPSCCAKDQLQSHCVYTKQLQNCSLNKNILLIVHLRQCHTCLYLSYGLDYHLLHTMLYLWSHQEHCPVLSQCLHHFLHSSFNISLMGVLTEISSGSSRLVRALGITNNCALNSATILFAASIIRKMIHKHYERAGGFNVDISTGTSCTQNFV